MGLPDLFLIYFIVNFAFVLAGFYMILVGEVPRKWKNSAMPILILATTTTVLLVLGLFHEYIGYIGAFVYILTAKGKINKMVIGKISEKLTLSLTYIIIMWVLSFVTTYWRLTSIKAGITLGIVYLAYSSLVIYSRKINEIRGSK
ncbi:hypothetical protein QDY65_05555 [Pyrococcus kukulkanii]|uniref:hypothetical protein n=1 Tax=Pyrococcus kukulkanii TaxID=1609559 RepID=UPI0035694EA5